MEVQDDIIYKRLTSRETNLRILVEKAVELDECSQNPENTKEDFTKCMNELD